MTYFLDESFRSSHTLYVVGVAKVETNLADVGITLKGILPKRMPRFHWRNETDVMRSTMLKVLVSLGVTGRAYVCRNTARQDRARARCLERLLWDLMELGGDELVFESRERHNDQRDRTTILRAQHRNAASQRLRYRFERAGEEPLLWLADAVAGAVGASLVDGEGYLVALADCVELIEVVA